MNSRITVDYVENDSIIICKISTFLFELLKRKNLK